MLGSSSAGGGSSGGGSGTTSNSSPLSWGRRFLGGVASSVTDAVSSTVTTITSGTGTILESSLEVVSLMPSTTTLLYHQFNGVWGPAFDGKRPVHKIRANNVKVMYLGDTGVGKTSLLLACFEACSAAEAAAQVQATLSKEDATKQNATAVSSKREMKAYTPTVWGTYPCKYRYRDCTFNCIFWDTAGDPGYDNLRPRHHFETDIFIFCFALDSAESLNNVLNKFLPEVTTHWPYAKRILVATKADIDPSMRAVKPEAINAALSALQGAAYLEVSSVTQGNDELLPVLHRTLDTVFGFDQSPDAEQQGMGPHDGPRTGLSAGA